MSFLSVLKKIGSVALNVLSVATSPAVVGIVKSTPIGAEYVEAVNIILALENIAPDSGLGQQKAALAVPAIQKQFPNAKADSVQQLNADIVAAFNRFAEANK